MYDPQTQAFEIKSPFISGRSKQWPTGYRKSLVTIWHVDPEKDGTDDSCGWFMRSRHGNKAVLERIIKRFEEDWDRVWKDDDKNDDDASGNVYFRGLFCPNGDPHMSTQGIVLNLFFMAACEHFNQDGRHNWVKPRKWMQKNLFDILMFGENPTDSLFDSITRTFRDNTAQTKHQRDERIRNLAEIVYGWILRRERPWYRHPRWHIHHWEFQIHFTQTLKRWLFSRCCKCGKGFSWGYITTTDSWHGKGPRWFKGEPNVYHSDCNRPASPCVEETKSA